jgi:nucleoside-diphosphate-sugar epimerase
MAYFGLTNKLLKGETIQIFNYGNCRRDFTYVDDIVEGIVRVMQGAPEMNIQDQTISDYWLERGDYVNIDYLTIGWNVPLRTKYVQGLRLAASVNNLATITGYSGLTPMINSSVINGTLGIDDKNVIPPYRSYTMSLSIQF